jgi:hypothetical protein
MTAVRTDALPFAVPESFRDLLRDEIAAAQDAVRDLELCLDALRFAAPPSDPPAVPAPAQDSDLDPW